MKKLLLSLALLAGIYSVAKAQVTYCTPTFIDPQDACSNYGMTIQSFKLTGASGIINDNTGCNGSGYLDQTATPFMSCGLLQATTYTATLTEGNQYAVNAQAWIDFNDDGTFDNNTETVAGVTNSFQGATPFSIAIPAGANGGAHRLRVLVDYYGDGLTYPTMDACAANGYNFGEARDYIVNIMVPCTGTPVIGSVVSTTSVSCSAYAPQLSLASGIYYTGLNFQWSSSVDNSTFTPIATATNSTYNNTVSSTLYFNCAVTCANGGTTAIAASELITVNGPTAVSNTCGSLTTTLTATGGTSFTWSPSASLNMAMGNVVVATPSVATNYMVTNDLGCSTSILVSAGDVLNIAQQYVTACTSTGDTLYANAFLNKGLVAYYPFNGDANDYSGNGYNATPTGVSLATDRFGNSNKCYNFSGTSTYLTCPPAAYFTGGDYTISGWVNVSNVQSWGRMIDFGNGPGANNVLIALSAGTSNQLDMNNDGGNNFTSNQVLGTNTWVQVLFTYHAGSGYSTCHYNGVAIDSAILNAPANVVRNNCYIGLSDWSGDGGVFGSMDDIRIYNRALDSTEIAQLYSFESTAEAQTAYSWSNGVTTPYLVANSATPSTVTYSVTQTRNGLSCTATNSVSVTTVACPAALNFDGVDDYVAITSKPALDNLGSTVLTLEAWVYVNSTGTNSIVRKSGDYNFYVNNANVITSELWSNGIGDPTWQIINGSTTIANNTWTHVAFTWNKALNAMALYVNGVAETLTINGGSVGGTEPLQLGASASYGNFMAGSIDEVRIWNIYRTPAQVQNDMGCINSSTVTPTGLLAYYNFDNGMANATNTDRISLYDVTGNGNNGTLTNFALTGTASNWVDDANQRIVGPSISVAATNTVICTGATTTLTVNGTATTYTWSANAASANTANIVLTPANTATYNIAAANAGGCVALDSIVVVVNPLPTVTVNSPSICVGATATLTAAGTATSYTWSTSDNTQSITQAPIIPTSYTVSGTDANNCVNMATATITVNALPTVSVTVTNSVICAGGSTTLSGAGANSYTWTGGVIDNTLFYPTGTNTYTITGTDANNCTNTATQMVTVNPLPTVTVNSPSICIGATATLTANGTATSYTWSTSDNTQTITETPTTPTSYTVSGTDANNCVNMATATVTVNALPTVTVNSPSICIGATATLTTNGTATSYTWSTNDNTQSITEAPTTPTSYTVSGTDANNCVNMATATITVNALPTVSVMVTNSVICAGASTTLSGAGAVSYTWTGGVTDNTPFTINAAGIDNYTVTGADINGCTNTAIATVTANPSPTVTVNSATICVGAATTLTVSGTATSYTWNTSATTTTISVTPTTPTNYTVIGVGANNCTSMATATVTVNALPTITVNTSTVDLCMGATATLTANGTATSYTWSTPPPIVGQTIVVDPTTNTSYTVLGSDANGCISGAVFTQTVSTTCQVGIEKYNAGAVNVTVFPNPSTGLYAVTLDADAQVTVINALGEVVLTKTMHAGTENIDIQNQLGGVYFVKVIQYNNQQTIKLIKN